jgi:formate dehydrogenase iron-sulfur subunit
VACKNWNQLKAEQTQNRGGHENPPDLSAQTWNRIMFIEKRKADGVIDWVFFNDRCRHCDDPPCMEGAEEIPEAIVRHESGAVIYTEKSRELDFDDLATYCPYDIPRKDPVSGRIVKCNLCIDRITHGLKPACVTACSTGTLSFGPRPEMLRLIQLRIKALGGDACLYPGEECNTIWILPESPKRYPIAEAPVRRRRQRLAGVRLPAAIGVGAMAVAGLSRFRERGLHDPERMQAETNR